MNDHEKDLGKRICHASVLFRRHIDNVVAAATKEYSDTVSARNFWVLRYLEKHRGEAVFQKDLETAFSIRRSTVSRTVELMEQKQLLVREPYNGDARLKRLYLTSKAEDILAAVSRGVNGLEDRVRQAFEPRDYEALSKLLERLCDILETPPMEFQADQIEREESNNKC